MRRCDFCGQLTEYDKPCSYCGGYEVHPVNKITEFLDFSKITVIKEYNFYKNEYMFTFIYYVNDVKHEFIVPFDICELAFPYDLKMYVYRKIALYIPDYINKYDFLSKLDDMNKITLLDKFA